MIKKILAALDASERASVVFDASAELAGKFGASLYVVRAITIPPEFPPAAATTGDDPLPAYLERVALKELSELMSRAPHLPPYTPIVAIGQPWRVILDTARELDVDLIVVGSHGFFGWDRVLGTTAGKVANLADRNVFVVHKAPGLAVDPRNRLST